MSLYTIYYSNGKRSKTFFIETCFDRVFEYLDLESVECVDIWGRPLSLCFTNVGNFEAYFQQNTVLNIIKIGDKSSNVRVEKTQFKCLSEVGGIFAEIPKNGSFLIDGQECTGFNVGKRWEFAVKNENGMNGITVCSHQDMLDAYKHHDCWYVRWTHPFREHSCVFVFDFTVNNLGLLSKPASLDA